MKLTDEELTMFIPIAEAKAKRKESWWEIILDALLELKQRRADERYNAAKAGENA